MPDSDISSPPPFITGLVAWARAVGATSTLTLTYTPPAAVGSYLLVCYVNLTAVTTSLQQSLSFTSEDGTAHAGTKPPATAVGVTGLFTDLTAVHLYSIVLPFLTDSSASTITFSLIPTAATFGADVRLYRTG